MLHPEGSPSKNNQYQRQTPMVVNVGSQMNSNYDRPCLLSFSLHSIGTSMFCFFVPWVKKCMISCYLFPKAPKEFSGEVYAMNSLR